MLPKGNPENLRWTACTCLHWWEPFLSHLDNWAHSHPQSPCLKIIHFDSGCTHTQPPCLKTMHLYRLLPKGKTSWQLRVHTHNPLPEDSTSWHWKKTQLDSLGCTHPTPLPTEKTSWQVISERRHNWGCAHSNTQSHNHCLYLDKERQNVVATEAQIYATHLPKDDISWQAVA